MPVRALPRDIGIPPTPQGPLRDPRGSLKGRPDSCFSIAYEQSVGQIKGHKTENITRLALSVWVSGAIDPTPPRDPPNAATGRPQRHHGERARQPRRRARFRTASTLSEYPLENPPVLAAQAFGFEPLSPLGAATTANSCRPATNSLPMAKERTVLCCCPA